MRQHLAALALLALAATPAAATTYVLVPDPVLADQAAVIAVVRIAEVRVAALASAPGGGIPATDYQVTVERLIQGRVPGGTLTVRVPGGRRPDGEGLKIWGAPAFRPGGRALLFLAPNPDGTFHVLHLMLGAFHEIVAGGRRLAVRDLAEASEAGGKGTGSETPRDLDRFTRWLADRAAGRRREADYFAADAGPLPVPEKFDLLDHMGTKMRWFEFDGGGSVAWAAHRSGQPGVPGGGFGEFQRGLAVWNGEPATPVRYAYSGETEATGGLAEFDGINAILFGQPLDDPFDCAKGGVLAIGGPWFSTERGPWNGGEALRILGADIVTNAGIECFFAASPDAGKAAEELFGHELGHTLGIDHSCTGSACRENPERNEALMRAWVHDDGRGARLSGDDRAALQALYLPPSAQATAPVPPGRLALEREGLKARLLWQDRSANEQGFRVYRGTGGGPLRKIAELPAGTTGYTDPGLRPATRYDYQVAAFNPAGERRGQVASLETARVGPLTVALTQRTQSPRTGEAVQFEAAFSGPARQARWDFTVGVGLSDAPCSPGTFCTSHIFTRPGTYTVTVTLTGDAGQTSRQEKVVHVDGPPVELPGSESFLPDLVSAGGQGDLWLHNAGEHPTLLRLTYRPRSASAEPSHREVTLAPQNSLLLRNVLSEWFGRTAEEGTLTLSSHLPLSAGGAQPEVFAFSRSAAVLEEPDGTRTAAERTIAGILREEGKLTASLWAANLDVAPGQVTIELRDGGGRPVGSPAVLSLPPRGFEIQPVSSLFPEAEAYTGPFSARFSSDGIRFSAAATLLAAESADPIFVPAASRDTVALDTGSAGGEIVIPRVARKPGRFDTVLISSLVAANAAAEPRELTFELWLRGRNNTAPLTARRTLAPGASLFLADAIKDLFGLEDALGALRVTWGGSAGSPPRILSFTFSELRDGQGKRFGMLVDSRRPEEAVTSRAVDFGAEQSSLAHSNYGVVNLGTGLTTLRLTLRSSAGQVLAQAELRLKGRQHLERSVAGLFSGLGQGGNWFIETEVLTGGTVLTYLSHFDASGGIFLVPGRKD